jgi:PAS domain S-box-containing protein
VSGYVMFESESPDEFRPYKGEENTTEVGRQIEQRDDQFAPLNGSEIDGDEVRGYHSVPNAGVNWVVVKEVPRSNALALTDQVQSDLATLIVVVIVGFVLVAGVIQYGPIRSIKQLARQADAIAAGDLTVDIENEDRIDEVGQLRESFRNTKEYVETIAQQSEKLSQQEFDADVLDEEIPGRVGESMAAMREDLERFITQLEAERERYSTLVEQSSDGVVVVTDGTVAFANDRFVEITGYEREHLIGTAAEALVVTDDDTSASDLRALLEDPSVTQSQVDIETGEGERRTVELAAAQIDHEGRPATLVNVRDVTERKRREQRLEVFNRVLRHNLRNDLDVVSANLEALESGESDPEAVQMAEQRLADLLSTAETARRIEQAFEQIEIRRYDLETVLDPLAARANEQYPECTLTTPDESATVKTADTLPDALWELLENACEHAGERPRVDLSLSVREDVAVLDIRDDGPGLPRTERQTIQSGEESAIQHSKGLGLWFAHWTAEASGGDLSFDVSEGTTVSLVLPLADVESNDST